MKKIKHFLDLDQISAEDLRSIIDLSKSYKKGTASGQDTHTISAPAFSKSLNRKIQKSNRLFCNK